MKIMTLILIALITLSTSLAQAAGLDQIFASTFYSGYRSGYCGDNVMNLIKRANQDGVDVSRAKIVTIVNKGFTVFGMVNAEYVRNTGKLLAKPTAEGLKFAPGESNWYHHVILELDGEIYDFDFGNVPLVADAQAYFDKMFLEEKTVAQGGKFYAGAEKKLADYEITLLSAQDYLKAVRNPNPVKMTLKDFLKR